MSLPSSNFLAFFASPVIWLFRKIDNIFELLLLNLQGHWFVYLFNLRAVINRRDIRLRYIPENGIYQAISCGFKRYFFEEAQNYYSYKRGFRRRAFLLARQYHLDKINFLDGDVIIDCGANVGDLELYFNFLRVSIQYIAFEPSPKEFSALQMNVPDGDIRNQALWSASGELDFFVSERNADSSVIQPRTYSSTCKVGCVRLDEVVFVPIKLLKLEAEGAEPEALLGSESLLPAIKYIAVDCGFERGVSLESTLPEVCSFLISHNFKLLHLGRERLTLLFVNKAFEK